MYELVEGGRSRGFVLVRDIEVYRMTAVEDNRSQISILT